jgi:hypothetical protein
MLLKQSPRPFDFSMISKPSVDREKDFQDVLSTENTERTEGKTKTRGWIFSFQAFFRDFRAFRGQKR